MKKIVIFLIFSCLIIFSLQQAVFAEAEEKEVREKVSELIKLLPTENKLGEITYRTIWKYVDKQSALDEEIGIETATALLRDIS